MNVKSKYFFLWLSEISKISEKCIIFNNHSTFDFHTINSRQTIQSNKQSFLIW